MRRQAAGRPEQLPRLYLQRRREAQGRRQDRRHPRRLREAQERPARRRRQAGRLRHRGREAQGHAGQRLLPARAGEGRPEGTLRRRLRRPQVLARREDSRPGPDQPRRTLPPRRLRDGRHRGHGLRRLLPHRLGLHRLVAQAGYPRRSGPWLGRRLDRGVLPQDHRHRPDPLRPALRTLPESRARVRARLRHRLLHASPRPGRRLRA